MKLRCVNDTRLFRGEIATDPSITLGATYRALCISITNKSKMSVRLITDDPICPALYPLDNFEIITTTIPPNWTIARSDSGGLKLSPAPWLAPGFWERFFDHEPDAVQCFREERQKIEDCEP